METKMRTRLFTLFLNLVMFVTFNLSTFPNGFADEPADDPTTTETDCEQVDPNAKNGEYIYKPGCEFEESRQKLDEWKPDTYSRIISALFAIVAVTYIRFNYVEGSKRDCSENKAANITIRAVQASAIAYLAGEIQANMRFKKAQKEAMDISFATEKTEDLKETNKQVEAFNALIALYEKLKGALDTKTALTSVAEAGFVAAEGIELANIIKCNARCSVGYAKTAALSGTYQTTLTTTAAGATAACVGERAGPQAASCAPTCGPLIGLVASFVARANADIAKAQAMAAKDMGMNEALLTKGMSFVKTIVSGVTAAQVASDGKSIQDVSNRDKEAEQSAIEHKTSETTYKTQKKTIDGVAKSCSSSVSEAISQATKGLVNALTKKGNVLCCGGEGAGDKDSGTLNGNVTAKSRFASKKDIEFKPLLKGLFSSTGYIERKEIRDLLKVVIYNTIYEKEVLDNKTANPKAFTKKLANIDKKIDEAIKFLDENASELYNNKADILADAFFDGASFKTTLQKIVTEVTDMVIPKAQATDFISVLGIAGGVILLGNTFEKLYTKWAGVTPKARAIYWGLMAGVNGYTLSQDIKRTKDIKKRIEVIKAEKKKFIDATAGTSISGDDKGGPGLELENTEYTPGERGYGNYPGCMAPTGDSYGPVKCPSIVKRDAIKVPQLSDRTKDLLTGNYANTLGSLSDVAYNAANGSYLDNPNLLGGQLGSATTNSKAMRAHNAKLRKKLDDMEKKGPKIKDRNGRELKPLSLSQVHEQLMQSLAAGTGAGSLGGAQLAKDSPEDEANESTDNKVAAVKIPQTQIGTPNTGFSLDLGLDDDSSFMDETAAMPNPEEQRLEDYVLEQNDINKKAEVSIFKILSNRYLLSYPKVLEEKK